MHLDRRVASVDTAGRSRVYFRSFLPYNLFLEEERDIDTLVNNLTNFYYWCSSRVLTLDRTYAKALLNSIGMQQAVTDKAVSYTHLSVTHPSGGLPSQSREQQERELLDLHDYVKENFGYEMSLFRYPAGKFSEQSLAIVQNVGYTSVFWSFAYKDVYKRQE